jgi:hypothetical protein
MKSRKIAFFYPLGFIQVNLIPVFFFMVNIWSYPFLADTAGLVDFLIGNDVIAQKLRDRFVFQLVPMLNPDGVVFGFQRTSFAGNDLNRAWSNPDPKTHPEVYATKNTWKHICSTNNVVLSCDFHGHAGKSNIFIYGCGQQHSLPVDLMNRLQDDPDPVFLRDQLLEHSEKVRQ